MAGRIITSFDNWPRRRNGQLIIQSTEEAIYLAHLIDSNPIVIDRLKSWRKQALLEIKRIKQTPRPNFQQMMDLAVRAQFFRECLEEVARIRTETSVLDS